jgi:HSP20 family protein
MNIARWDPFRELEDMSDRLSRLITRPRYGSGTDTTGATWSPPVDIVETPSEYLIKAELPEVNKEDIRVHVENGVLALEGERRAEPESEGKRFHRTERPQGRFARSFGLPEDVDPTKVRADYRDGMLLIRVAKAPVAATKAIDVKVS